ncbi:universal stress protein [Haloarcula salina]|uniref:Universal stress protein n=1 Tax=Haloarcula salina TaxID=1429914 RepID=A0AA41KCA3_9EURY|nr:universal stress protein [Haloarcula salina]MBV0902200.1 universal stress protein [Haloarcula salina]
MTFVVPFDGSAYAEAALVRAREFAPAVDETVQAVTVVPRNNARYARERGWLGPGEPFDLDAVVDTLAEQVHEVAPLASFHHETCTREVSGNTIARPIRKFARQEGATMVFIGSDSAGRLTRRLSSVGERVSADVAYDVVIVRRLPESAAQ